MVTSIGMVGRVGVVGRGEQPQPKPQPQPQQHDDFGTDTAGRIAVITNAACPLP